MSGTIDVHTHGISPDLAAPQVDSSYPAWPTVKRLTDDRAEIWVDGRRYREIDDRCWSPVRRLLDMDARGVDIQVVSPLPVTLCHEAPAEGASAVARAQNLFFADLASANPARFRVLGAVPLQDPRAATKELRFCLRELGFAGVEIGCRVGERELSDPEFDEFFAAADELGALVLVHPVDSVIEPRLSRMGVTFGAGMPNETCVATAGLLMAGLLVRRPRLRLCLAHGGGSLPAVLPRLDEGARLRAGGPPPISPPSLQATRLYCDSLTYDVETLLLAIKRFGTTHVMFGSDYPFAAPDSSIDAVLRGEDPRVPAAVRDAIARANAWRVLSDTEQTPREGS